MAALPAQLKALADEAAFRIYVTDSLFFMGENKRFTKRYYDIINPKKIDTRTPEEIVAYITSKYGLKLEANDECICPDGNADTEQGGLR